MTIKSQLYLLQLEDYDLTRYIDWLKKNSTRHLVERKGKIRWTIKAKILYLLAFLSGSIETAVKIYSPIDEISHQVAIFLARVKLLYFHRNMTSIGVTGSWGKTTTKEKLTAALGTKYKVFCTQGNHNTLLGVAVDILKIPFNTKIFVCEMGAYRIGDIRSICQLVKPKIGVITAIGPMHLERFGSIENIGKAKAEIWETIPKDGLKIGPDDDPIESVSEYFLLDKELAKEAVNKMPMVSHRLEKIQANGLTVIDDSYNSNPAGFKRAINELRNTNGSPKILITPGMIELGELQMEENKKAAILAKKVADMIIFVGQTNKKAWEAALKNFKNVKWARDLDEARSLLEGFSKPGAVILFENDLPDHYD